MKHKQKIFSGCGLTVLLLYVMGMMGCSFHNPILGTWNDSGGEDKSITFY